MCVSSIFYGILAASLLAAAPPSDAKVARSARAKAEFRMANPCPSTGKVRGACPGYVVDHVLPLCGGGPDEPSNMRWQTVEDGKLKDREEREACRALRGKG